MNIQQKQQVTSGESQTDTISESSNQASNVSDNKCPECHKSYKSRQTLNQHRRKQHNVDYHTIMWHNCLVPECSRKFIQLKTLTDHVVSDHKIYMGKRVNS